MLEHQPTTEENIARLLPQTQTPSVGLPPQAHAVLVGYLAQTQSANEDTETTHARLEELTLAYLELDVAPHEAALSAIRQLENERLVQGASQALSTKSQPHLSTRSVRPATLTALKLFGPGALVLTILSPFLIGTSVPSIWYSLMIFLIIGLPALLGIAVGMRARQRPALGTFYAVSLLIPIVALITEMIMDIFTQFPHEGWMLGMDIGLFWLPIGCLTAGLTGWGRNLRYKRSRDAVNRMALMRAAESSP